MYDRTWRRAGALMVALVALATIVSGCRSGQGPSAASSATSASPGPGDSASGGSASGPLPGILSSSNPFASPATSLGSHGALSGPPAAPFAGTPAEDWANGAAGITVPAAHPVGTFSASQVAAAYAMTRRLLIAQNLDRATLLGGRPMYVEFFNWADPGGTLQPWVLYRPAMAGGRCGMSDGYTHPDFPSDQSAPGQPSDQPSGTPIDPYSMADPRQLGNCQATTGT